MEQLTPETVKEAPVDQRRKALRAALMDPRVRPVAEYVIRQANLPKDEENLLIGMCKGESIIQSSEKINQADSTAKLKRRKALDNLARQLEE